MAAVCCESLACENSFRDINRLFANGVTPEIASALSAEKASAKNPDELYAIDMGEFDKGIMQHFEKDWMGLGGDSWFGPEAGQMLYKAYVYAIKNAGDRQIKGIWIEREDVSVQVMEDSKLVLVILGAPLTHTEPHQGNCGKLFSP